MIDKDHYFVEWKEHFVSQERGNRVVHYFLKDSAGESVLAVVGTERSLRHMFYVVADEFLQTYGKESSIQAGFKWRSRREVVDWLTSMLSKQHRHGDATESPNKDLMQAASPPGCLPRTKLTDAKGHRLSFVKGLNSDIVWSGVGWSCGKQLKHYPAFSRNGTVIAIQSFVYVMAKGDSHYVAYLEDMYEDRRGQKKVKVRWFHHVQEVKGVIPIRNPHPREVFITPYSQVISAECVDGLTSVLTREHYEKCSPTISPASLDRIHLCFRQFRSNRLKPFDITKLGGYFEQPILLALDGSLKHDYVHYSVTAEDSEDLNAGDSLKLGAKRTRSDRGSPRCWIGHQGVRKLSRVHRMTTYGTYQDIRYMEPSGKFFALKRVENQAWCNSYKVDEKIELLCQDSGIRGCWFRCTILQVTRKHLKVQYDDLQDEEGSGNLEEWVPALKHALPDKLGMRNSARLTIRPSSSLEDKGELALQVGAAVDAWWSDGWWEGVVTEITDCSDVIQVYFPGESLFMSFCKSELRRSRDWLGDQWFDIKVKPDVVSMILGGDRKQSAPFNISKNVEFDGVTYTEVPDCNKSNIGEEKKLNLTQSASSSGGPQDSRDMESLHPEKEIGANSDNFDVNGCFNDQGVRVDNDGEVNGHCSTEAGDSYADKDCSENIEAEDIANNKEMEVLDSTGQDSEPAEVMEVVAA